MSHTAYKIPISVLVIIHTPQLDVLLMERADRAGFWQSVTGSLDDFNEPLALAAAREVKEETGIDIISFEQFILRDWHTSTQYSIYPEWRHRYRPDISINTEHWFSLEIPHAIDITLAPREHVQAIWLPYQPAIDKCFSPSNQAALTELPQRINGQYPPSQQ